MNVSDTEFITEEEISEEKNKNYNDDGGDFIVLDGNDHIVSAENGEDESRKTERSKQKQI